jgi:hypothetical protein
MSSGGSSPSGTTTVTSTPWTGSQPYITYGLQNAQNLLQNGVPQYYPGQQVASFNPLQEQAFSQIQNLGSAPNPVQNSAQNYFTNLESGSMLSPQTNPQLQGLVNQGFDQIQNNLASQFAGGGRNIEASAPVQASQMGNLENQVYGGAYNNAVNNMTSALSQTSPLTTNQYTPSQMLSQAGGNIQQQAQNIIQGNMNQWAFNQQAPWTAMNQYMGDLGQAPLGQQTSTPYFTNPTASGMGGALAGYQLGNDLGGYGGYGAALGGLLGYYGG